ncbi:hypothetical protein BDV09DRAFT_176164 [Aspergillus tetrazonus]
MLFDLFSVLFLDLIYFCFSHFSIFFPLYLFIIRFYCGRNTRLAVRLVRSDAGLISTSTRKATVLGAYAVQLNDRLGCIAVSSAP